MVKVGRMDLLRRPGRLNTLKAVVTRALKRRSLRVRIRRCHRERVGEMTAPSTPLGAA